MTAHRSACSPACRFSQRPSRPAAAKSLAPMIAVLSLLAAALSGCASAPALSPMVGQPASAQPPVILGADGPLTGAQTQALLQSLAATPDEAALLQRHMAIEQAVAADQLLAGETTQVIHDGAATYRAMFAAIRGGTRRIDLEYYVVEDIESDGVRLSDLLLERRRAGIEVNLIYDSLGSLGTPHALFERLRQAGVTIVEFNPVNPFKAKAGWSINRRDHRKILVVDDAIAIVGGVNLDNENKRHLFGKSGGGRSGDRWRDTDLSITGPAVAQAQALFQAHWSAQKGPPLADLAHTPARPSATGRDVVRIVGSAPAHAPPRFYPLLVAAIRSAERNIDASTAYFAPTPDELQALVQAAQRGVAVRLLLPAQSDSALALANGRSRYGQLLQAGVKLYEANGVVLHAKTLTVDGVWSVIGSSNLDHRSVLYNDEVDAVVLGSQTAHTLAAQLDADIAKARPIGLDAWRHRSFKERLLEAYSHIWQSLL